MNILAFISLADNDFGYFHEIPSEFNKLANLSYLNLASACFARQIPIAISCLTRLVTLDLSTYYSIYELKLENPNLKVLVYLYQLEVMSGVGPYHLHSQI